MGLITWVMLPLALFQGCKHTEPRQVIALKTLDKSDSDPRPPCLTSSSSCAFAASHLLGHSHSAIDTHCLRTNIDTNYNSPEYCHQLQPIWEWQVQCEEWHLISGQSEDWGPPQPQLSFESSRWKFTDFGIPPLQLSVTNLLMSPSSKVGSN